LNGSFGSFGKNKEFIGFFGHFNLK
jgi:hypothetical protein